MSPIPVRKSTRLKDYDYSQSGCYFITVCTYNRAKILSDIGRGGVLLRPLGEIVNTQIHALEQRYNITIYPNVIMPDHVHMIIHINRAMRRAEQSPAPTMLDMVCAFKSITTKIANKNDGCLGRQIWQRGYYDHIIRNDRDYEETAEYILNNPLRWVISRENKTQN